MNKIRVIVSHPGKQYVHQLLYALQKQGYLQLFITSIWYKPSLLFYKFLVSIPAVGKILYGKFLKKKQYPFQQDNLIEQAPWSEFKRQILVQFSKTFRTEKYVFQVERKHDFYTAERLKTLIPDIFIGYEKSSLESFKVVKKQGGITVLDLAQVHYKYLEQLRLNEPTFKDLFEDEELFSEINKVKHAEYEYADYILTLSEFAKSTLIQFGIESNKIKVINLGYNPEIFKPKTTYLKPETRNSQLNLVYTGTFTKRKGLKLLFRAIRELNLPDLKLTIIGPVLDGQELFDEYRDLFTYFDFLHHEEMVKHIKNSDVYVFPSYLDSWAMTVTEAMACGLPVIVTETTGAKDAVKDGESGFILPSGDIQLLKQKIQYFYNNRDKVKEMGILAAQSAAQFTWDHYYSEVNNFIISVSNKAEVIQ